MSDYNKWIESVAKGIIEETGPDDRDGWHDEVWEATDSSYYVTHNAGVDECLDSTKEPDPRDVAEMVSEDDRGDWRKVKEAAAFVAIKRDLEAKLRELSEGYFRCAECDNVVEGEAHDHDGDNVCADCLNKLRAEDEAVEEENEEGEETVEA